VRLEKDGSNFSDSLGQKSGGKNRNFTAKKEFDSGFFWVGRIWANKLYFILASDNIRNLLLLPLSVSVDASLVPIFLLFLTITSVCKC
jgi:hypothetical protein